MTSAETTIGSKGDETADRPSRPQPKEARKSRLRGWLFTALFVVVAAAAGAAAARWYLISSKYVSTDNAYVGVSSALVTPLTSGAAASVPVHDTQLVKQGDVLVTIDPQTPGWLLAQADAAYGLAVRRVQRLFRQLWRRARPITSAPSSITNGAPSSAIPARFRATNCRRRKTISNPPRRRSTGRRR